ncbi:MAG: Sir2 family NAD-dependent protein deacetylase [Phycisphaerales bacterium]|nr:Sir2 family NAD-dependent protein deacetylase [Phycisphaerales bacterium]|tara:strand:+ start:6970 stop:7707 length:738 start_codon:yes stop_codon:yes gene_type:complete
MNDPHDERIILASRAIAKSQNPCCFSGAGLSAPSGVGTFRDPGDGWWSRHDPMKLASPDGFAEDPELVMKWYAARRIQMAHAQPNAGHLALACRPDIIQITQNTDDLLKRAGCDRLIQLHGDITSDRCHGNCGHVEHVDMSNPSLNRYCPACSVWGMRPTVTWFGESLPTAAWALAEEATLNCDLMLVVGTSAVVYPAAALIELASRAGATIVIINSESTAATPLADHELIGSAEEILPRLLGSG